MSTAELVEVDVERAPHQVEFVDDVRTPVLVMEGGLGCGKTFSAMLKMLVFAELYPGVAGLVVEPTNDLIGTIFLATVDEFLPRMGIAYEFRRSWRGRPNVLILHPGTTGETPVYLRSGDRPERIVGFKIGWFILDEADSMDADVYRRAKGRLRDRRVDIAGGVRQACLIYTPEPGFNWTWSLFHEKRTPQMRVIEGVSTRANVWNPSSYADELESTYDGDDRARVTTGARSAREGLVYRSFSDERNLGRCVDPWAGDVELWCDFNAAKMAWAWVSLQNDRAFIFDELVREDTDSEIQAKEAALFAALQMSMRQSGRTEEDLRRVPPAAWPIPPSEAARRVTVVGDAASDHDGGASGATRTSHALIRQQGFTVRHKAANPGIDDTVLTVNVALRDGWLVFDADRAPYTTRCIRQQPYGKDMKPAKGQGSRDKVKAGLDHGADCIRYGTWFHRPVWDRKGNDRRH